MRLFIAVEISPDVRIALSNLQRELKPFTNSAKWVAPDSIHITLKFLGEVVENRLPAITSALSGLRWPAFMASIRDVGFFPPTRSPRVFWAGIDAAEIRGLAEVIEKAMESVDFEKEKRDFRPHITLARARDSRLDPAMVQAAAKYHGSTFGAFPVDRVFLFKSTLRPSGAVYEKLGVYVLNSE